jgi:AAA15 family ATPase/GTPase
VASNYDKATRVEDNLIMHQKIRPAVLKSAVIFGANASGKSRLLEGLEFMRNFVLFSSRDSQIGDAIAVNPFRLNTATADAPSAFEVIFIYLDVTYRYGFEATGAQIVSEWLFQKSKTKEVTVFYRDGSGYSTHERLFSQGKVVVQQQMVRKNALLISVAAQFNDPVAIIVLEWFKRLKTLSGLSESKHRGFTLNKTKDAVQKHNIMALLKAADLGIQDFELKPIDMDNLPEGLPGELRDKIIREVQFENKEYYTDVLTKHRQYNDDYELVGDVSFSLDDDESAGTIKYFALTGPILEVLEQGYTLIVDELDAQMHPNLVSKLVSLFNSKETNTHNAQLIFNSHDTNLLGEGILRRDQIWFTSKNKYGESSLYSLADFSTAAVRKNDNFEKHYVQGRYGAVPFLGFFDEVVGGMDK